MTATCENLSQRVTTAIHMTDQKMVAVHGTLCMIPPCNSNQQSTEKKTATYNILKHKLNKNASKYQMLKLHDRKIPGLILGPKAT
jgi:hypothetical protein